MSNENLLKFRNGENKKTRTGRWFDYFATVGGRKMSRTLMGAVSLGIPFMLNSYQTLFIDYYLDFIRLYRHGLKVEVPEEIELLIDQAADRVKLTTVHATHLKSFMVSGLDIKTCGSLNSIHHGFIGIPVNYLYDSELDIDKMNLKLRTESIDWDSKCGELLEKSLILTEKEKMFGIIRSILELRNYNHVHNAFIPFFLCFGLYTTAQAINQKYKLFLIPRAGRGLIYGALAVFTYGLYSVITDTIRMSQMLRVDDKLTSMGSDVIEGGIGFYEKMLNRNIAMRELSGKDLFSVKGNEYPGLLRYNALPLTKRKKNLEIALEEARKKEKEAENSKGTDSTPTE
ncbi:transmembrane protein 177 [Contarinia nasturtii]|uniref:transmembrane protein 177 n=1 Tax=Contarinia nasturtii TaxID=265458 RepID=UPI0012D4217A|nr:transmembrane protein 177 [Contarinia nasturtii]